MSERRGVKSYVIRGGRLNPGREKALQELYGVYGLEFEHRSFDPASLHPSGDSQTDIIVEIGFGVGEAIIELARCHPEKMYIGIEVFPAGVATVLRQVHENNIKNVAVVMHDAVEVVNYMLPDSSIHGFHVFFPDPWPKKKHHKRRLLNIDFITLLCKKLEESGYLYIVTDWDDYASEIQAVCSLVEGLHVTAELPEKRRPKTRYENKARTSGRGVHQLAYRKNK